MNAVEIEEAVTDLVGILQTNNIQIAVCAPGEATKTLAALRVSPATSRAKARFVVARDGAAFEVEDLSSGETVACDYADFPDHFGSFLPLAGITTAKQLRESSLDIRGTSRPYRLYCDHKKTTAPSGKDRKQVLVYLDAGLIKDLKVAAVQRDTSASAIAGEAIKTWLKSRGLLTPQSER